MTAQQGTALFWSIVMLAWVQALSTGYQMFIDLSFYMGWIS